MLVTILEYLSMILIESLSKKVFGTDIQYIGGVNKCEIHWYCDEIGFLVWLTLFCDRLVLSEGRACIRGRITYVARADVL